MSDSTAMVDAVKASDVVGTWQKQDGPMFMCPGGALPPDECDCGYVGNWEYRWVYVWHKESGFIRGDKACRRDLSEGRPARFGDEGWWVMAGRDERCPACGDVERYDSHTGECLAVNLNRVGRIKRAAQLRERAKAMELEAWRTPLEVDHPESVGADEQEKPPEGVG